MDFATLKPLFESAAVQKALLIDDAFDPLPAWDDADLAKAWSLIEKDDEVEDAWKAMGGTWPAPVADFALQVETNPPLLAALRAALALKDKSPANRLARELIGHALQDHLDKRVPLDALKAVLSQVGIEPTEIGSNGKPSQKYPLIFLDYYLGDDNQPSVERSIERIKDVLKEYAHDEMPIVVLMSSLLDNSELAENFRGKAELLGCQFKFVTKDKFTGAAFELVSSLADRAEHLSQARDLSYFVKTWRDSLNSAIEGFASEIKSLDLQDFYFIWKKAGEGKNNRFGEHISTMFDNYLRKLVEEQPNLTAVQKRLKRDHVPFDATQPDDPQRHRGAFRARLRL